MRYSVDHELLKKFISGKYTPEEAGQLWKFLTDFSLTFFNNLFFISIGGRSPFLRLNL